MKQSCNKFILATGLALVLYTASSLAGGGYYGSIGHHWGGHSGFGISGHYSHHGHGDAGTAAGVGLLFGFLLGSAIHQDNNRYYDSGRPRYNYTAYGRPAAQPRVIYHDAATMIAVKPTGPCLQAREYQAQVTIGGKKVAAYGIACLQADGTWNQGPSRLVPKL